MRDYLTSFFPRWHVSSWHFRCRCCMVLPFILVPYSDMCIPFVDRTWDDGKGEKSPHTDASVYFALPSMHCLPWHIFSIIARYRSILRFWSISVVSRDSTHSSLHVFPCPHLMIDTKKSIHQQSGNQDLFGLYSVECETPQFACLKVSKSWKLQSDWSMQCPAFTVPTPD